MTVSEMAMDVAMPDGTASGGPNVRALTRARARPSVADSDRAAVVVERVQAWSETKWATIAADWQGSWLRTGTPPTLAEARARPVTVPGGHPVLRGYAVAYKYAVSLPSKVVLYPAVWLLDRPAAGTATLLTLFSGAGVGAYQIWG